jgi:hypothetical protein
VISNSKYILQNEADIFWTFAPLPCTPLHSICRSRSALNINVSPNTGDKLKVVAHSPHCCIARALCQSPVGASRKGLFKLPTVNEEIFFGKGLCTLRAAILEQWEITLLILCLKWHLCKGFSFNSLECLWTYIACVDFCHYQALVSHSQPEVLNQMFC